MTESYSSVVSGVPHWAGPGGPGGPGVGAVAQRDRPAGPQFWVFRDRQLEGAARPLADLGLPPGEEVDAVFSWPLNGKTYLVRGRRYWRYDEAAARPDPGYPRDLSLWEGAPHSPDDVAVSNGGRRASRARPACKLLAPGGDWRSPRGGGGGRPGSRGALGWAGSGSAHPPSSVSPPRR